MSLVDDPSEPSPDHQHNNDQPPHAEAQESSPGMWGGIGLIRHSGLRKPRSSLGSAWFASGGGHVICMPDTMRSRFVPFSQTQRHSGGLRMFRISKNGQEPVVDVVMIARCISQSPRHLRPEGMTSRAEPAAQDVFLPISTDLRLLGGVAHEFSSAIAIASRLHAERVVARGEVTAMLFTEPSP
jgi:hypothetical protein